MRRYAIHPQQDSTTARQTVSPPINEADRSARKSKNPARINYRWPAAERPPRNGGLLANYSLRQPSAKYASVYRGEFGQ